MKRFGVACFYFFAIGVASYAGFGYGFLPLGSLVHPDLQFSFMAHKVGIYTHVFASLVALALSPFQFSSRLRRTHPRRHRIMGRLYLGVGVALGGLSALYMAAYAYGGVVARLGFACLAVCWLFTGLRAFLAIRQGAVQAHRKWVVRNVSLTLAAVSLRIYLPSLMGAGMAFDQAYPLVAWLCWIPNLLVAEWFFVGKNSQASKPEPV